MDRTLFDKNGNAVAYIASDYNQTIYLWDGYPVAYLYEDQHLYGFNGRHLGWFINEIIYDNNGIRIGFTAGACPVTTAREPVKPEKYPLDQIRPRWKAPPTPKLSFSFSEELFRDFLKEGQLESLPGESSEEESEG